jgi:arginyl-tRNA synthetase
MLKELEKQLKQLISNELELVVPPNKEMGDLAIPCFKYAEKIQKNPVEVAKETAQKIQLADLEWVSNVKNIGPYINIYLNTKKFASQVLEKIKEKGVDYGSSYEGKDKKILIEYPSQNTHKEFHVGHLRNICIGNTLVNLYKKHGYKVIPINYINDFGAHVAKCLWGILNFHKDEEPEENKQEWLGNVYAEATKAIDDNEEKKKEVAELQKRLETKDPEIYALFEKTKKWSLNGFDEIQKELKTLHEKVFFESDIKENGQKKVNELLEKGIAKVGEGGAVIVDLEEYDLGIALVKKSSGVGVYMTSDLALVEEKKKLYPDISESINVTGIEQNFYFKQLYKILELMGFEYKMTHIGYGLVNLSTGKMSSRKGNVVLYKDVFAQVFEYLRHETKQRHTDWGVEKIDEVSKILTLGAIKFSMQKHEAVKNFVFDIEEVASVSGYTGLYPLYTVARINSVLAKINNIPPGGDMLENEEKDVVLLLAQYEDVCDKALTAYNPSVLTRYCFDLSTVFNNFYTKYRILDKNGNVINGARVELCKNTKKVLENALKILSIDTVQEM